MKVSILMPMSEKPPEVIDAVLASMEKQEADQLVLALDRVPGWHRDRANAVPGATVLELTGPPGWRSPCLTFNAGLAAVTGDVVMLCHGDIVLAHDACRQAREILTREPAVTFGMVLESDPSKLVGGGHAGPVLQASSTPRAMLYLCAMPTAALRAIGGWDEAFMAGCCYEDDDVVARLWKAGDLPFIWDDRIAGVHQSHRRSYFMDQPVAKNLGIFLEKHETSRFLDRETALGRVTITQTTGLTRWAHA